MADIDAPAVTVKHYLIAPVKHPIKAARLLFTPPSWVLRGPIYVISLAALSVLAYSVWATVDELVQAPLVLQREAITIEAIGGGIVVGIAAKQNQPIRFGDPAITVQEQTRIMADTEQAALEGRRFELRREMDKLRNEYDHRIDQLELDVQDLTTNRESRKTALEGRIKQIEQQRATAVRAERRTAQRLALASRQLERRQALFDSMDITIREFESAQQRVLDLEKDLDDARAGIAQVDVALATAREELVAVLDLRRKDKLEAELRQTRQRRARDLRRLQEELDAVTGKLSQEQQLVEGVTFEKSLTHYNSNYNGLVTEVHVKKGQIITPGTPLFSVVRETAPLEARVLVQNKDIGHLTRGQEVKIKYFAYPYQEYGIQEGNITEIATKPGGVPGHESMYVVTVALKNETIAERGGRARPLEIGIEGIAEIKTGEKRMIEIVFSPVSRFFDAQAEE